MPQRSPRRRVIRRVWSLDQRAPAADLEPQRDERVVVRQDRAQVARAHQVRDGARIPRVGLAFASRETLTGAVHRDAGRMHEGEALRQQDRLEETGAGAHHVEPDHRLPAEAAQLGNQAVDRVGVVLDRAVENDPALSVNGHRPMCDLRSVNSDADPHTPPSLPALERMPRLACIALQSHRGHRVISGRSEAATRAAKRPKPSRTAGMTAIPASPARRQLPTTECAVKRGKAA